MSVTDVFPLIKAPEAWPVPVVATVAMVCLAGLDLVGRAPRQGVGRRTAASGRLVLGAGAFLVLFWVYASSLRYAELALVTMGWIVMLQVGLVLVDRWRYGVELPTGKWVAIGIVLVAQAYLVLAPSADAGERRRGLGG